MGPCVCGMFPMKTETGTLITDATVRASCFVLSTRNEGRIRWLGVGNTTLVVVMIHFPVSISVKLAFGFVNHTYLLSKIAMTLQINDSQGEGGKDNSVVVKRIQETHKQRGIENQRLC